MRRHNRKITATFIGAMAIGIFNAAALGTIAFAAIFPHGTIARALVAIFQSSPF